MAYNNFISFTLTYSLRENGVLLVGSDTDIPTDSENGIPDLLEFVIELEEFIDSLFIDKCLSGLDNPDVSFMWMNGLTFCSGSFRLYNYKDAKMFQDHARDIISEINKNENSFVVFDRKYTIIFDDLIIDDDGTLDIKYPDNM